MFIPISSVVTLSTGEMFAEIPDIERCPNCELSLIEGRCMMCGWPEPFDDAQD
jgi:rubredoxin